MHQALDLPRRGRAVQAAGIAAARRSKPPGAGSSGTPSASPRSYPCGASTKPLKAPTARKSILDLQASFDPPDGDPVRPSGPAFANPFADSSLRNGPLLRYERFSQPPRFAPREPRSFLVLGEGRAILLSPQVFSTVDG